MEAPPSECRSIKLSNCTLLVLAEICTLLTVSYFLACLTPFLPERDYVALVSLLSPIPLSSVVCLSVTLVHPTQGVEPFGNISSPLFTEIVLREPLRRER